LHLSRELARREGIFTGISGGATLAGALEVCRTAPAGSTVLCMLPDTGERYLSTPLFEDIPADMSEDELEISRSTPSCRFDAQTSVPAPAAAQAPPELSPAAEAFVDETVADAGTPVVVFALEWCEFCWSVRKLFAAAGIPYRSVDLDSADYQKDGWGGEIRKVLQARTGAPTIPQIYVGGEHIGGCTETFDAYRAGRIHELLAHSGIALEGESVDPYSFLPAWLHPR
jgi:cysteine synthase A